MYFWRSLKGSDSDRRKERRCGGKPIFIPSCILVFFGYARTVKNFSLCTMSNHRFITNIKANKPMKYPPLLFIR